MELWNYGNMELLNYNAWDYRRLCGYEWECKKKGAYPVGRHLKVLTVEAHAAHQLHQRPKTRTADIGSDIIRSHKVYTHIVDTYKLVLEYDLDIRSKIAIQGLVSWERGTIYA
jgi:hypothetical protein